MTIKSPLALFPLQDAQLASVAQLLDVVGDLERAHNAFTKIEQEKLHGLQCKQDDVITDSGDWDETEEEKQLNIILTSMSPADASLTSSSRCSVTVTSSLQAVSTSSSQPSITLMSSQADVTLTSSPQTNVTLTSSSQTNVTVTASYSRPLSP